MIDINNLNQQQLDYLWHLKTNGIDKETAFTQLEQHTNSWKFLASQQPTTPIEPQTLWSEIKSNIWEAFLDQPKRVLWAWKWLIEWVQQAPDIFWDEWWRARLEQKWIEHQQQADISQTRQDTLTNLSEESLRFQFKLRDNPASVTNEEYDRQKEIKAETEAILAQPTPLPPALERWVWVLQEVTAPAAWPIQWFFWKIFWWVLWAWQWALKENELQAVSEVMQSWIETIQEADKVLWDKIWEPWEVFKKVAWITFEVVEPILDIAWAWEIAQLWKNLFKSWVNKVSKPKKIDWPDISIEDQQLLKETGQATESWNIWWIEVQVPKVEKWIIEKGVETFTRTTSPKVLAWKAVSPRTLWKNPKLKLKTIKDVESRTKEFYDNIRTWKLEWDISTLENTAETMISNLDTVWERIWEAVKKVEWNIEFDTKIVKNINNALKSKSASVSPATWILSKFDEATQWPISIDDAFEIKKAYWNELSKMYKSWDAGTKQYKALSDWVAFLNKKIDTIIDKKLWPGFADDKKLFWNLKSLVDDIVSSALVEWRGSPQTLVEQIWHMQAIFSPIDALKNKFLWEISKFDVNTRGWAWKELIKQYDQKAVKDFWTKPLTPKSTSQKPTNFK